MQGDRKLNWWNKKEQNLINYLSLYCLDVSKEMNVMNN